MLRKLLKNAKIFSLYKYYNMKSVRNKVFQSKMATTIGINGSDERQWRRFLRRENDVYSTLFGVYIIQLV